jgi:hypothetical protein
MRLVVALALFACTSPARAPESPHPAKPPVEAPRPSGDAPPIPTVHAPRDVAEAPHAGAIQTLALSPDGKVVLSSDELGGVRLWPSLDGTLEPRIVEMPTPRQLAVGRRTGGFTAVARDEAGGLYIAKLDEAGRQVSHATLPGEPAVTGMAMTAAGLLAWRSDQTLVVLDADGATKDKLATEARQRLVAVAVSGTRAVALLEREGKRQARWLTLAPKLAWGAWIDLQQELLGTVDIALSPNGKRLAAALRTERMVTGIVLDLANGKSVAASVVNTTSAEIGFADDDHVALGGFQGLRWIDLTTPNPKPSAETAMSPGTRPQAVLGTGGGQAVTAMNGELALTKPGEATQYLGYETVSPRLAEVGPDGRMLVHVGEHVLLLDKQLQVASTPFSGVAGRVAQLRWLGESDWLLESSSPNDATMQIALANEASGTTTLRAGLKEVQLLQYEPSTQLVTLSFGASSEVARFDRKARKLDHLASVAKASPYEQVVFVPVSPELARGTKLVQVTMRERSTVKWLRDPAALDKPSATVTIDGPFAGADAAGNVYMWRNTPAGQLELVVYADGKAVRTLPNSGAVALWPEPNGQRYVEVAQSSVALYDQGGKQLWFQQLATSQEALWLTDGAIAITSAGGVARLDPATGAVIAARCGWRFGLATKPHPATPRVEPLCAQLRR